MNENWLDVKTQNDKATALQADILRTDKEIDGVVYGLGAEEVKIVEGGN